MFNFFDVTTIATTQYQNLVSDYCRFLEMGHQHFSNSQLKPEQRLKKLDLLEKALRKDCPISQSIIAKLQRDFLKENLSISLLLDPLIAWRYLAYGKLPTSETQLTDIVNAEIAPLARLLMALYNQNPATYMPINSLLVMFVFINLFVTKNPLIKNVKLSKRRRISKLNGLLKNSKVALSIISSLKLKFRVALAINSAQILLNYIQNNKQLKFTFLDYIQIFLYSSGQLIFVRKRSVSKGV